MCVRSDCVVCRVAHRMAGCACGDWLRAAVQQQLSQGIAIIGSVGEEVLGFGKCLDPSWSRGAITHLARGEVEAGQASKTVSDGVDFGCPPAPAAPDRLGGGRPFHRRYGRTPRRRTGSGGSIAAHWSSFSQNSFAIPFPHMNRELESGDPEPGQAVMEFRA